MQASLMKKVSMALALALTLALSLSMVACGGKADEEVIREGVTAEFDSIKNMEDEAFNELLEGFTSSADLSQFGVDNAEFCRAWLDGFDYTVDDVTVDGDSATVKVTITVKSLERAMTTWQDEITAMTDDPASAEKSTDELYAMIGTVLMDCVAEAPMITNTIELPYVLNGNTWEPGPGFDSALGGAFLG